MQWCQPVQAVSASSAKKLEMKACPVGEPRGKDYILHCTHTQAWCQVSVLKINPKYQLVLGKSDPWLAWDLSPTFCLVCDGDGHDSDGHDDVSHLRLI